MGDQPNDQPKAEPQYSTTASQSEPAPPVSFVHAFEELKCFNEKSKFFLIFDFTRTFLISFVIYSKETFISFIHFPFIFSKALCS